MNDVNLFDGEHINCWMDAEVSKGCKEETIFITIFCNGITISMPKSHFMEVAKEIFDASHSLISYSRTN